MKDDQRRLSIHIDWQILMDFVPFFKGGDLRRLAMFFVCFLPGVGQVFKGWPDKMVAYLISRYPLILTWGHR